jgi:4-amino-4-deoxy-L-arabinose transferase-like glycosyltransferase
MGSKKKKEKKSTSPVRKIGQKKVVSTSVSNTTSPRSSSCKGEGEAKKMDLKISKKLDSVYKFLSKNFKSLSIDKNYFIILALAIVFFLGTSSFNFYTQSYGQLNFVKWASPDETSNYFFSKLLAQEGKISIDEKYNLLVDDVIRPRSIRSDHGVLKPMSFLGIIIIYGSIGAVTSYKVIPFLTPLFASIALFYFYALTKKLFSKNIALVSAFLLAIFPPFIYYSVRSMFHNVLFTVLLIVGLYYVVAMVEKKIKKKDKQLWWRKIDWRGIIYATLAGLFLGLAISVRSSELLWLAPLLLIIWLTNIRKVGLVKLLVMLAAMFAALLPTFYYNQILFGSTYLGGYAEMNQSIVTVKDASANVIQSTLVSGKLGITQDVIDKFKKSILIFGLHPRQSASMFYYYLTDMFPWLLWGALGGFVLFLIFWKQWRYRHWVYLAGLAIISLVLVLYYGSWVFFDNPDHASHTIGNSYTRYWLPIYLGLLPLVSIFIIRITSLVGYAFRWLFYKKQERSKFWHWQLGSKFFRWSLRITIVAYIAYISLAFVLTGSEEGLVYLAQRQIIAKQQWQEILELTPDNSVIITMYHDKLFFPERKIVLGLFDDDNMNKEYAKLIKELPLYYYNFTLAPADLRYLNDSKLRSFGLHISKIKQIDQSFALYKLYPAGQEINSI